MTKFIDRLITDPARLKALSELQILDTDPEQRFDDLVMLASTICHTPVALISFLDDKRQWFKAITGFPACQTPLNDSVCRYTLHEPDVLVISDLSTDERTKDISLVTGEPHIRFYAGAPIFDIRGLPMGSLCVIDMKPRPQGLTDTEKQGLKTLARQVMMHLEARRLKQMLESTNGTLSML